MEIGNLGKAIAFASLWAYAAYVGKGAEPIWMAVLFVATAAFSVYVIFLFDSKPYKK